MESLHNLCISCGGTGGHFYPGLAVAQEWKKQGGQVLLLIGGKHAVKQHKTASDAGIDSIIVAANPLSSNPVGMIRFGLAAFLPPADSALAPFPEKERAITLRSTAGTPYRDPELNRTRDEIKKARGEEVLRLRASGVPKWYRSPGS